MHMPTLQLFPASLKITETADIKHFGFTNWQSHVALLPTVDRFVKTGQQHTHWFPDFINSPDIKHFNNLKLNKETKTFSITHHFLFHWSKINA